MRLTAAEEDPHLIAAVSAAHPLAMLAAASIWKICSEEVEACPDLEEGEVELTRL